MKGLGVNLVLMRLSTSLLLINGFRNREQLLRFKNELIEQHDGASEEIEKIFDSFEALYHDYTSYLGIPKLRLTPSQYLHFYL